LEHVGLVARLDGAVGIAGTPGAEALEANGTSVGVNVCHEHDVWHLGGAATIAINWLGFRGKSFGAEVAGIQVLARVLKNSANSCHFVCSS